jgi:dipeptidyl aminopeptidase/acylaminoacyl peptidase
MAGVIDWIPTLKAVRLNDPIFYSFMINDIGDAEKDAPALAAMSPAGFVEKITAPVFMAYDTGDLDLPFAQVRKFSAALKKAGVQNEVFTKYGEAKGFSNEYENREELFKAIEKFITTHMPAARKQATKTEPGDMSGGIGSR